MQANPVHGGMHQMEYQNVMRPTPNPYLGPHSPDHMGQQVSILDFGICLP